MRKLQFTILDNIMLRFMLCRIFYPYPHCLHSLIEQISTQQRQLAGSSLTNSLFPPTGKEKDGSAGLH